MCVSGGNTATNDPESGNLLCLESRDNAFPPFLDGWTVLVAAFVSFEPASGRRRMRIAHPQRLGDKAPFPVCRDTCPVFRILADPAQLDPLETGILDDEPANEIRARHHVIMLGPKAEKIIQHSWLAYHRAALR